MTILINLLIVVMLLISNAQSFKFILGTFFRGMIVTYLLSTINIVTIHFLRKRYEQSVRKANVLRYVISSLAGLTTFTILIVVFAYWQGNEQELLNKKLIATQFMAFVILNVLIIVLQNQVLLQHSKAQSELENMQLKAAISEASNLLLRQQIHPHFLFNSLNILKSLYKKDTGKGEFYLTKLANFLRASVSNHTSKISLVDTELNLCMDYMEMQQVRFGQAIEYTVDVSDHARNYWMPFFAVQVLLENAIKHNMLTEDSPLKIRISDHGNFLTIQNNLQIRANKEVSTGFGLANLSERYQLLSGDDIDIKQTAKTFSVTIKLYNNESINH